MQKCVSIVTGLALLMSTIITGIPESAVRAGSEDVPNASWPHSIATDEATIVVYPPQEMSWKEYCPKPANLIVFDVDPVMSSVQGANLLFAGRKTGGAVKGAGENVYAGADGNVYRRNDNG
jgi:hypothetical protein